MNSLCCNSTQHSTTTKELLLHTNCPLKIVLSFLLSLFCFHPSFSAPSLPPPLSTLQSCCCVVGGSLSATISLVTRPRPMRRKHSCVDQSQPGISHPLWRLLLDDKRHLTIIISWFSLGDLQFWVRFCVRFRAEQRAYSSCSLYI